MNRTTPHLLLCLLSLLLSMPTPASAQDISAEEVLARFEEQVSRIRDLDVQFTIEQHLARETPSVSDVENYKKVRYVESGPRYFMQTSMFDKETGDQLSQVENIWTGDYNYTVYRGDWKDPDLRAEMQIFDTPPAPLLMGPKQVYACLAGTRPPLPLLAFRELLAKSPVQTTEVDGQPVYELTCNFTLSASPGGSLRVAPGGGSRLTLALSCDFFLPLEITNDCEGFRRPDKITKVKYGKFGDVMFPTAAVRQTSDPEVSHSYQADLTSVAINAGVDGGVFTPDLEQGDSVTDYVLGRSYLHVPDELVTVNIDKLITGFEERATTNKQPSERVVKAGGPSDGPNPGGGARSETSGAVVDRRKIKDNPLAIGGLVVLSAGILVGLFLILLRRRASE